MPLQLRTAIEVKVSIIDAITKITLLHNSGRLLLTSINYIAHLTAYFLQRLVTTFLIPH